MRHKKCLNLLNYGYGCINENEDFSGVEGVFPWTSKP
jgi:hypothetical protein